MKRIPTLLLAFTAVVFVLSCSDSTTSPDSKEDTGDMAEQDTLDVKEDTGDLTERDTPDVGNDENTPDVGSDENTPEATDDVGDDDGDQNTCGDNEDCPEGDYCKKTECSDTEGVCASKPSTCPTLVEPVCGCDGVTYNNACLAGAAGVNTDETGTACLGRECVDDGDCQPNFCFKRGCFGDDFGVCTKVPATCPDTLVPVCGCNGTTYNNECLAQASSMSVDPTFAACASTRNCSSNHECTVFEYYKKDECTAETGVCTLVPKEECEANSKLACGCDGVFYPSACVAAKCRTNIHTTNYACQGSGLCERFTECSDTEFCQTGTVGCAAKGQCKERPRSCEVALYNVCGCDNRLYSNYCEAAKAGAVVKNEGLCPALP
ncbi:MAG: Kazal-type serine protease inhibitor domain-containing protein [Myxococcota bacterium]|jgi:hypothetical protein